MNDEMTLEEHGVDEPKADSHGAAVDGIEVDEPAEIESIELGNRRASVSDQFGWETVSGDFDELPTLLDDNGNPRAPPADAEEEWQPGPEVDPRKTAASLEDEHLRLAAELARLRADGAAHEHALEEEITTLRTRLADREAELSDQEAQIASLTLTCDGLRSRLSDVSAGQGGNRPAVRTAAPSASPDSEDTIASLKARLEERGNALTVAREEAASLRQERSRLADALAERGEQVAQLLGQVTRAEVRHSFGMDFRSSLWRLLRRNPDTGTRINKVDWQPDSPEEPTIAVEESVPAPAAKVPLSRRDTAVAHAIQQARAHRKASKRPALQRYLISLEPDREEVIELKKPRCYVGRGGEADVRITDETVSRLHGVVYLLGGATMVEDACSTNGVFVNRHRVRQAVLTDGDTVAFGSARYQFRVGTSASGDG